MKLGRHASEGGPQRAATATAAAVNMSQDQEEQPLGVAWMLIRATFCESYEKSELRMSAGMRRDPLTAAFHH